MGGLSDAEGIELLARCAEAAIAEQRSLGLTEWTGGDVVAGGDGRVATSFD